ncbi:MAG: tetratricopeptide repeat protein [Sedimentisphaerales bacterium]|nr:tetratricopeptide repeat protein [Sedimentisphaerales bacterium]
MKSTSARFRFKEITLSCLVLGLIFASGCASPKEPPVLTSTDEQMGRLAQQARTLFDMQRPAQAAPLYEAALGRARALDDDTAIARLAYNLGACRLESGDAPGAAAAFEEAIHAARAVGLPADESQLLLGYALLQQGKTDRVLTLCGKAIRATEDEAESGMRLRFQLLRAEAYLRSDKIDLAEENLQNTIQQLAPESPPAVRARAKRIEGTILSRRGRPSESANVFLREAGLWSLANRPIDVTDALVRAADEQQRAEEISAEAESRYRAARALLSLERYDEASAQLDRLEHLPQNKWPESLTTLVPLLRREVDQHLLAPTDPKNTQS